MTNKTMLLQMFAEEDSTEIIEVEESTEETSDTETPENDTEDDGSTDDESEEQNDESEEGDEQDTDDEDPPVKDPFNLKIKYFGKEEIITDREEAKNLAQLGKKYKDNKVEIDTNKRMNDLIHNDKGLQNVINDYLAKGSFGENGHELPKEDGETTYVENVDDVNKIVKPMVGDIQVELGQIKQQLFVDKLRSQVTPEQYLEICNQYNDHMEMSDPKIAQRYDTNVDASIDLTTRIANRVLAQSTKPSATDDQGSETKTPVKRKTNSLKLNKPSTPKSKREKKAQPTYEDIQNMSPEEWKKHQSTFWGN